MWILYFAMLFLVPCMLGFMFWRATYRLRRDRLRVERQARQAGARDGGAENAARLASAEGGAEHPRHERPRPVPAAQRAPSEGSS